MPKLLNKTNLPNYDSAPSSPANGDIYYNTTDHKVYARVNGAWVDLGATGGGASGTADANGTYGVTTLGTATNSTSSAIAATPSAVKTTYDFASTKAKVSVGTAQPSSPSTGDIWVDTAGTLTAVNAIPSSSLNAAGAMIYASGVGTAASLAIGTPNQVLAVSSGTVPSWTTQATAGTSTYGITSLTDSVSSTSTTTSATPKSVKTAYDAATTAIPKNTVTAAGDMLYASGSAAVTRLPVGTANQVLTVQSNTPTWTTPTVGSISTITGTATWSAYSTTSLTTYSAATTTNTSAFSVTGNGTVLHSVTTTISTGARTLYYWNLSSAGGTATRGGTATPALTTAGTVQKVSIAGKGFSGDGVIFFEGISATTSGSISATLRRYTNTLATNSWNTTIYAATAVASTSWNTFTDIAYVDYRPIWAPEANMWLGWDTRSATGTSFVYAVNDTTGTLYSSAWGTYVASNDQPTTGKHIAYIPGVSGADGTAHFFAMRQTGTNAYNYLRISYTLGTAAITAASTVTNASGWPGLSNDDEAAGTAGSEKIIGGYWDSGLSNYVLITNTRYNYYAVGFERTMGTVVWRSRIQNSDYFAAAFQTNTRFDPVTRIIAGQNAVNGPSSNYTYAWQAGSAGDFYIGMRPLFQSTNASSVLTDDTMMGAGSATHIIKRTGGSAVQTIAIANSYTSFTVASSTAARLISFVTSPTQDARPIASISATNAYPLNFGIGEALNSGALTDALIGKSFPIILPANETMTVYATNHADTRGGAALALHSLNGLNASTAVYTFKAISLG